MNIVVFGLSISSAWGNGHATLLRGLFRALNRRGHEIHFFERDTPYYASHRDAVSFPFATLHLYSEWNDVLHRARQALANADVGMVTSYCPDGIAACDLVLDSNLARTVFYDMDTPVTLSRLEKGEPIPYLPKEGLGAFDLVLSYTGAQALERLREHLRCAVRCPLVRLGRSRTLLSGRAMRQIRVRSFLSRNSFGGPPSRARGSPDQSGTRSERPELRHRRSDVPESTNMA